MWVAAAAATLASPPSLAASLKKRTPEQVVLGYFMCSKEEPTRVIRGVVQQGGRAGQAGVGAVVGGGDSVVGVEQLLGVRRVDEGRGHAAGKGRGDALQAGREDERSAAQGRPLADGGGRCRLIGDHGLEGGVVGQRQPLVVVQSSCTQISIKTVVFTF